MKDKRFRSKLNPFYLEILYLRSRQVSYDGIVKYLADRYGLTTSKASISQFLKCRERRGILPKELQGYSEVDKAIHKKEVDLYEENSVRKVKKETNSNKIEASTLDELVNMFKK
ncbi:MAG TPA: hypothetical protein QF753_13470 [Victivallales bacterium]|nr:hypothetical protein [Victivallales bacterium]